MESVDPKLAQRVWQRVQGTGGSIGVGAGLDASQEVLALAALEQSQSAAYMQLSRRFVGKTAALLLQLGQRKRSRSACMRGIYRMLTGQVPANPTVRPGISEHTPAALCRCCTQERALFDRYQANRSHPEYGSVFASLADQTQLDHQSVLSLLGELD